MQNNGHSDTAHDKNSTPSLTLMLGLECVLGQKLGEERSVCFSYVWFTMLDIFIGCFLILLFYQHIYHLLIKEKHLSMRIGHKVGMKWKTSLCINMISNSIMLDFLKLIVNESLLGKTMVSMLEIK